MNTYYFANIVAGHMFGSRVTPSIPSVYYIGLSSTAPNADGSGVTEPDDANYERVQISGFTIPAAGVVTNSDVITWPRSSAHWGRIDYFVIYDAQTNGNLLIYGKLPHTYEAAAGTSTLIAANTLRLYVPLDT